MEKKIPKVKGGRPSKDKEPLIQKRTELIVKLLQDGMSRTDVAFIFSVHPAQISRVLEERPK